MVPTKVLYASSRNVWPTLPQVLGARGIPVEHHASAASLCEACYTPKVCDLDCLLFLDADFEFPHLGTILQEKLMNTHQFRSLKVVLLTSELSTSLLSYLNKQKTWGYISLPALPEEAYFYYVKHEQQKEQEAELVEETRKTFQSKTTMMASFYDPLTEMRNKFGFKHEVDRHLQDMGGDIKPFGILIFDVDQFTHINELVTHERGDAVLAEIGKLLEAFCSEHVLQAMVPARIGGDEFALLLPRCTSADALKVLGDKLVSALNTTIRMNNQDLRVSVSAGYAHFPDHGITSSQLVKNAELAMFKAKDLGKQQGVLFTKDILEALRGQITLENELHQAALKKEFLLYLQPQFKGDTREIYGAECLIRWAHPSGRVHTPDKFLHVLEGLPLFHEIEDWIVAEGFRLLSLIQRTLPEFRLSVNLSAAYFHMDGLLETIDSLQARFPVVPGTLIFELTETSLVVEKEKVSLLMNGLKKKGILLALDDFGTEYSSLSYLQQLPFDYIKVDKAFLKEGCVSREILRFVRSLTTALGIDAVVEGVETADQLQYLNDMGYSRYQGYLVGKPVPPDDLLQRLAA